MRYELKSKLIEAVHENGKFMWEDLSIKESRNRIVTISYDYGSKEYYFLFTIPSGKSEKEYTDYNTFSKNKIIKFKEVYLFNGSMLPGKYVDKEEFSVTSIEELSKTLDTWLNELEIELSGVHNSKRLEDQEKRIKEIKEKVDEYILNNYTSEDEINNYASEEEIEHLKNKLNELEEFIKQKIDEFKLSNEEKEKDIESLKNDFEKLRKSAEIMNKKNFFKNFAVTTASWTFDPNKRLRLAGGLKLIENTFQALGINVPQISALLPESKDLNK